MQKTEIITELAVALHKAQQGLNLAKKDKKNQFFKSSYADLRSVWETCKKPLGDNNLAVIQTMGFDNGHHYVETMLLHTSGQYIMGVQKLELTKVDMQGIGSAVTYARRYGLMAILGICPEDDDAEGAVVHEKQQAPASKPPAIKSGKKVITEKQGKRLIAIAVANGFTRELIKDYILHKYQIEHLRDIPMDIYDDVVKHFEAKPEPPAPEGWEE